MGSIPIDSPSGQKLTSPFLGTMKNKNTPWNKGLTKETDERVKKISNTLKGRKRKKFSKEHREKLSRVAKENKHGNYFHKGKDNIMHNPQHNRLNNKNPNWKYGCDGYYHSKARKIAEKITGIKIKYPIVVHHIDGNIKNNNPNNLLICLQGYHISLHNKMNKGEK